MQIDKSELGKNRVLGNWIYYLKNGGGIHGKIKNWKDGDPEREPAFAYVFRQEIKPGIVLFDIGANLGYYSFVAAQIMQGDGSIYAIEPDPRNVFLMKKSVNLNYKENSYYDMIEVHELAISNRNGTGHLHLSKATNLSCMEQTEHTTDCVEVNAVTLSTFAWKKRVVNNNVFIRMDIEGHEVEALEGAMTFLKKGFPCKIFMEVHPQFYSEDHSLEKVLKKLLKIGFKTKVVVSAAIAVPTPFKNRNYKPDKIFNCGRFERGLYTCINDSDMLQYSCFQYREEFGQDMVERSGETHTNKIVRSILLERS